MKYITVLIVSAALGVDAFSVAVSIGSSGAGKKKMLAVTGTVTIFHILMPLLGLTLGDYLGRVAGPAAGIIGALVLIAIGLSAIWSNIQELHGKASDAGRLLDISSPGSLVLMAASVSIDALTVGFGLGTLKADLFLAVVTMGIVAGLMTASGLLFGRVLNRTFGGRAEIIGGLILVMIGVKLLL